MRPCLLLMMSIFSVDSIATCAHIKHATQSLVGVGAVLSVIPTNANTLFFSCKCMFSTGCLFVRHVVWNGYYCC